MQCSGCRLVSMSPGYHGDDINNIRNDNNFNDDDKDNNSNNNSNNDDKNMVIMKLVRQ